MEILITGPLKGNVERLKGLVEVSNPEIVIVIGPLELEEPLKLGRTWLYTRGAGDDLKLLSRSDGIDVMSRLFKTKEGISFAGISGIYHPSTARFTRQEWIKAKGKLDRRKQNYIFREDIENLIALFLRSGLSRIDFLVISDIPTRPVFEKVLQITRPKTVFYPAATYTKEKVGDTTFVGLEEISSQKGKYILRV